MDGLLRVERGLGTGEHASGRRCHDHGERQERRPAHRRPRPQGGTTSATSRSTTPSSPARSRSQTTTSAPDGPTYPNRDFHAASSHGVTSNEYRASARRDRKENILISTSPEARASRGRSTSMAGRTSRVAAFPRPRPLRGWLTSAGRATHQRHGRKKDARDGTPRRSSSSTATSTRASAATTSTHPATSRRGEKFVMIVHDPAASP